MNGLCGLRKTPKMEEGRERMARGEGDQIKFIDLRFGRWEVVGFHMIANLKDSLVYFNASFAFMPAVKKEEEEKEAEKIRLDEMSEDEYEALPEEEKSEIDRKRLEEKKKKMRRKETEEQKERELREERLAEERRLEEEKCVKIVCFIFSLAI